ncbi:E3 ubiquitin-protein ligase MGRN1 isoform X2 [Folsomia candida]|uniref:E3 ubiquitin-protein ligase MGRN1 isoform X2 n=1 Tax=Folsomia candida TaxID=158441 RepID=UPI000B8EEC9E|nr:E3 ubiquitin-protein ligase MGRN1 isoform X2 [Folsomia candida]
MGTWWSRPNSENSEVESPPTAFRYPSKTGNYFGTHFIMGGERFETPQPEQYLFGDNTDLNFLGSKPVPFPYPAPQSNEPTKTLKALINIRKETLKFVKVQPQQQSPTTSDPPPTSPVKKPIVDCTVEFVFDADCRCEITILYFCVEEVTSNGVYYRPKHPKMCSEPIKFKAGSNQVYINSEHVFHPAEFPEQDLLFDSEKELYPVVIQCIALEGDEPRQSHTTTATVDKYSDGSYSIKPLKQKLFVDGLVYLLQEIYGIENKNASRKFDEDDSDAETSAECVICMSDSRDTLILPCRHLCLCHACADSLRYQASNCPICRAPFRALLQIRAVYRIPPLNIEYSALPPEMPVIHMNAIPGYEVIPLLEALNGPYQPSDLTMAAASLHRQEAARAALNDSTEGTELRPIAMTVMVAPSSTNSDIATTTTSTTKSDDEKTRSESPITVIHESSRKSSAKLSKSSSDAKTPVTSDPEDEAHFSEAAETLPDLEEFGDTLDSTILNSRYEEKLLSRGAGTSSKPDDEEMQLQSIESSPVHGTNVLMIAAIDEFSDEEDTTRTRRNVMY